MITRLACQPLLERKIRSSKACFNRPANITSALFDGWREILHQLPALVLWVVNDQPRVE